MLLYVGTFTDGFMGGAPSQGLYVIRFVDGDEQAEIVQIVTDVISPSFLCAHAPSRTLFAAERKLRSDAPTGAASAWRIGVDGKLHPKWKIDSGGASCAHINVSRDGSKLAVANPMGPTVGLCLLGPDGAPLGPMQTAHHSGKGARPRQNAPWPHSATFDANGTRLLVCDLGLDRIYVYDADGESGALHPASQPFAQVSSGAGARHLAWSASGRTAFVANELDSTVSVFDYDAAICALVCKQTLSTLPESEAISNNQPAEVVVSPNGRNLYVSNRGAESIAWFDIHPETERLHLRGQAPSLGATPRHFALTPKGDFAFCANQLSGEIVCYSVGDNGSLAPLGPICAVPSASCIVAIEA
ncbi:MAG: lactonase family protein [Nitrospiraceae bacterium]